MRALGLFSSMISTVVPRLAYLVVMASRAATDEAATFELAVELVRPAGRVANIGVHGRPVTLHLERLWSRDLTITTGLVDTSSTPTLLRLLAAARVDAARFVTHRFGLDDIIRAYDTFSDVGRTGALKVVLSRV
ncbi:hypothetical protein OG767_21585 [Micromonospora sp. NBC_01392]|uniref:hypothetical protein n=1 Tax=Micromonospora sp. NBC_01392 TaxID=2903588 RepID=UPI00324EA18C